MVGDFGELYDCVYPVSLHPSSLVTFNQDNNCLKTLTRRRVTSSGEQKAAALRLEDVIMLYCLDHHPVT